MPIGDEEDSHLGDLIEDQNAIQPIDAMIQSNLRETTTRVLASLTPREERIVRMRSGLGMNSDHSCRKSVNSFRCRASGFDRSKPRPSESSSTQADQRCSEASSIVDLPRSQTGSPTR
jgi:hypothetical protein